MGHDDAQRSHRRLEPAPGRSLRAADPTVVGGGHSCGHTIRPRKRNDPRHRSVSVRPRARSSRPELGKRCAKRTRQHEAGRPRGWRASLNPQVPGSNPGGRTGKGHWSRWSSRSPTRGSSGLSWWRRTMIRPLQTGSEAPLGPEELSRRKVRREVAVKDGVFDPAPASSASPMPVTRRRCIRLPTVRQAISAVAAAYRSVSSPPQEVRRQRPSIPIRPCCSTPMG